MNSHKLGPVGKYISEHFLHFNAAAVIDAAQAYQTHLDKGGKMFVTLAGAMSTAELGKSLAEMIRQDKVHGICCTGANLEEDVFNLVAHDHYVRVPNYRDLTPQDEVKLAERKLNRVTDTCIPEDHAVLALEKHVSKVWKEADAKGERIFPHEIFYRVLRSGILKESYQIDPKNSWMLAACEKNLPIFVPGWEDSTLGNIYTSYHITGDVKNLNTVKSGLDYMVSLADWYAKTTAGNTTIGFFQIGGGIAGDFPICVVPLLIKDLKKTNTKLWGYFCQISDSTTSYGSYSGAVPNEKITWGKLGPETPKFVIESDATIVAPLMFAYLLGW